MSASLSSFIALASSVHARRYSSYRNLHHRSHATFRVTTMNASVCECYLNTKWANLWRKHLEDLATWTATTTSRREQAGTFQPLLFCEGSHHCLEYGCPVYNENGVLLEEEWCWASQARRPQFSSSNIRSTHLPLSKSWDRFPFWKFTSIARVDDRCIICHRKVGDLTFERTTSMIHHGHWAPSLSLNECLLKLPFGCAWIQMRSWWKSVLKRLNAAPV